MPFTAFYAGYKSYTLPIRIMSASNKKRLVSSGFYRLKPAIFLSLIALILFN